MCFCRSGSPITSGDGGRRMSHTWTSKAVRRSGSEALAHSHSSHDRQITPVVHGSAISRVVTAARVLNVSSRRFFVLTLPVLAHPAITVFTGTRSGLFRLEVFSGFYRALRLFPIIPILLARWRRLIALVGRLVWGRHPDSWNTRLVWA